ncbi:hypothetical protein G6O69_01165 [Pseudenhygromyxa sp. WMMC2535]|uniref:hypothetical protein n=1 Tax=Pseudenhygromyxa sp. WMMC2535 TaxID=2712867 RepID=UPI0015559B8B|nr:hypothetical protein [Pseudenhygromyxa sp. WMMC2535]NVB36421.1 hypothetical protein [Pseudenhygromyxa sp. WMMC2535]
MSFGAQVLVRVGDSNTFYPLEHPLACAITEIRVEQHLERQTTFAIRFQEDFPNNEALVACERKFKDSTGIAIVVPSHDSERGETGLFCLVRGQVEQNGFDIDTGAAGSSFEVRGQDLRTLANRECRSHKHTGKSSEILKKLLETVGVDSMDIGESTVEYKPETKTFNFRGTVLDCIQELARKSDFSFWLSYEIGRDRTGLSEIFEEQHYEVQSTAHVTASPRRPEDESETTQSAAQKKAQLLDSRDGSGLTELLILPVEDRCETVINFTMNVDNEATEQASAQAIDIDGANAVKKTGDRASRVSPLNEGGVTVQEVGMQPSEAETDSMPKNPNRSEASRDPSQVRSICVGVAGDKDVNESLAQGAANQGSWYVKCEALTTVFKLGKLVEPHELVSLGGGGDSVNGVYQVSDVTHVINAADHWMSIKLRTNSRGCGGE